MKKVLIMILLCLTAIWGSVFANSAEPPTIVIVSSDAPSDLTIYYIDDNNEILFYEKKLIGESNYTLTHSDIHYYKKSHHTFKLVSSEGEYFIELDGEIKQHNAIYRLDYSRMTLKPGKGIIRSIVLVSIRLVMTLMIEGAVFFIFGYRSKETWTAFLVINLLTQGGLNLWLNFISPSSGYIMFTLVIAEILILITELAFLTSWIDEMDKNCSIFTILVANAASFYLGMKIIPLLPV